MTANGDLTHGAPVDGLGLVFVLGSVPHERQPFNSCQSTARDKQGRKTAEQAQERWGEKKAKEKQGQNIGVWLMLSQKETGEMQKALAS